MKINPKFVENNEIEYLLDCGDKRYVVGHMQASIAEEIVRSAKIQMSDVEGYELRLDSNILFPKDAFIFEPKELEARLPKETKSRQVKSQKSE